MNNSLANIYRTLRPNFLGQLLVAGSHALKEYGLVENPNEADLDLVLLHEFSAPDQPRYESDKKILEMMGSLTLSKNNYPDDPNEPEETGKRFFFTFNQGDKKIDVHVFLAIKLFEPKIFESNDIRFVSPMNVIKAKKAFNRKKDIQGLFEIAKTIMS